MVEFQFSGRNLFASCDYRLGGRYCLIDVYFSGEGPAIDHGRRALFEDVPFVASRLHAGPRCHRRILGWVGLYVPEGKKLALIATSEYRLNPNTSLKARVPFRLVQVRKVQNRSFSYNSS